MRLPFRRPQDPAPDAEWEVWYRDTFDRECPPSVDVRGRGLVEGLKELWARHLFETVRPDGSEGFSRFHLRWGGGPAVRVDGSWPGAIRLRAWVFGTQQHTRKGYVESGDKHLLERIAMANALLLVAGSPCEQILAAAVTATDERDFLRQLESLPESIHPDPSASEN